MERLGQLIGWLESNRNSGYVKKMARFAIRTDCAFGIPIPLLRTKARETGKDHALALALWQTGMHEARLLATMIADPLQVDPQMMDAWTKDFDSWDLCDQCCFNLFRYSGLAYTKIQEYASDEREFVRRTAFVLVATLAVSDKSASDETFAAFLPLIVEYAMDPRNFVKKAVDWALRQIGKRNMVLNALATDTASRLAESVDPTARWIGRDAKRELTSEKVLSFIQAHRSKRPEDGNR